MNSVNVAPPGSLRVLCSLPLDLGLAVLKQCSPMDLVNLAMSCKVYRRVIFAHPNLWDLAYDNLARGMCPRLPSRPRVEASGNYWEEAYVLWIFGGGPCSYCSKITATVPFHFLFRFRACSSKCQRKLSSYWKNRVYKGSLAMADTFPFNKGLPHLRNQLNIQVPFAAIERAYDEVVAADEFEEEDLDADDDTPFKIRSREELEEEYVLRERSRPAIEKNAEDLQVWRAAYLQEMNSAAGSNLALVKLMLKEHALEERAAMACPESEAAARGIQPRPGAPHHQCLGGEPRHHSSRGRVR
ncbi:hypothetical protein MKEN_00416600 [Mycena kentingensis (nom. inval.)]|nr:hypothetical protein MKEN_00416600 [Mycena kentingensis (nom. inval.)]